MRTVTIVRVGSVRVFSGVRMDQRGIASWPPPPAGDIKLRLPRHALPGQVYCLLYGLVAIEWLCTLVTLTRRL